MAVEVLVAVEPVEDGDTMKVIRTQVPQDFFSSKERKCIRKAIEMAEMQTSGEIRVHLQRKANEDILVHAAEVFDRIGMSQTEARNGVLIFMGLQSRRFVVIGDQGINEQVAEHFWQEVVTAMQAEFQEDRFADGLVKGIELIGYKLQALFPYQREDKNELSDEISFSF